MILCTLYLCNTWNKENEGGKKFKGVHYCIILPQKWIIPTKVRTSKECTSRCMFQLGYLNMHLMRLFKQPQKLKAQKRLPSN